MSWCKRRVPTSSTREAIDSELERGRALSDPRVCRVLSFESV